MLDGCGEIARSAGEQNTRAVGGRTHQLDGTRSIHFVDVARYLALGYFSLLGVSVARDRTVKNSEIQLNISRFHFPWSQANLI